MALWSLLRGSIVWITWIDRNAWSFQNDNLSEVKLQSMLWEAFLTLGRAAWSKTLTLSQARPRLTAKYFRNFNRLWMTSSYFGSRAGNQVHWTSRPPRIGSFSMCFKKIKKKKKNSLLPGCCPGSVFVSIFLE
jgi:hypothetical protein